MCGWIVGREIPTYVGGWIMNEVGMLVDDWVIDSVNIYLWLVGWIGGRVGNLEWSFLRKYSCSYKTYFNNVWYWFIFIGRKSYLEYYW